MDVVVRLAFDENEAVSLLNWIARHNCRVLQKHPEYPGVYDGFVDYEREEVETWCDIPNMLAQGVEDCDGLACARAGELMARGYKALRPGDGGYEYAKAARLPRIRAEVILTTNVVPGDQGTYHCLVQYTVGGVVYHDDPSARLGMLPRRLTSRETQKRIRERVQMSGEDRRRGRRRPPTPLYP